MSHNFTYEYIALIVLPWATRMVPRKITPGCFISKAVIKCILSFSASSKEQRDLYFDVIKSPTLNVKLEKRTLQTEASAKTAPLKRSDILRSFSLLMYSASVHSQDKSLRLYRYY